MVLPNCLLFLQTYEVAFSDTRMQRGSFRGSLIGTLNILRPQANAPIEAGRRRWRRKHFTAGMDCHRAEFVGAKARDQLSLPDDAVFPPALDEFYVSIARPETRERLMHLVEHGLQTRSEGELDLGHQVALPR